MPAPLLKDFLETKPLYYKEIDHRRVHDAYTMIEAQIEKPPVVHIVGTNGKGSTGRMIAYLAFRGVGASYFSVGTSLPPIF